MTNEIFQTIARHDRLAFVIAVAIVYDILRIIVLFRIWNVRITRFYQVIIFLASIAQPLVGYGMYKWARWKFKMRTDPKKKKTEVEIPAEVETLPIEE